MPERETSFFEKIWFIWRHKMLIFSITFLAIIIGIGSLFFQSEEKTVYQSEIVLRLNEKYGAEPETIVNIQDVEELVKSGMMEHGIVERVYGDKKSPNFTPKFNKDINERIGTVKLFCQTKDGENASKLVEGQKESIEKFFDSEKDNENDRLHRILETTEGQLKQVDFELTYMLRDYEGFMKETFDELDILNEEQKNLDKTIRLKQGRLEFLDWQIDSIDAAYKKVFMEDIKDKKFKKWIAFLNASDKIMKTKDSLFSMRNVLTKTTASDLNKLLDLKKRIKEMNIRIQMDRSIEDKTLFWARFETKLEEKKAESAGLVQKKKDVAEAINALSLFKVVMPATIITLPYPRHGKLSHIVYAGIVGFFIAIFLAFGVESIKPKEIEKKQ